MKIVPDYLIFYAIFFWKLLMKMEQFGLKGKFKRTTSITSVSATVEAIVIHYKQGNKV